MQEAVEQQILGSGSKEWITVNALERVSDGSINRNGFNIGFSTKGRLKYYFWKLGIGDLARLQCLGTKLQEEV